jgi:NADH-quinone oxidoreductase subunit A
MILVTGFALVSVIGSLILGMRKPTPQKQAPYECGMQPVGTARERFSVKFYLVAMLFLLFDIEAVFLFPWAVVYRDLKLFGFFEMLLFIAVVLAGYVYVWKKGALEWER